MCSQCHSIITLSWAWAIGNYVIMAALHNFQVLGALLVMHNLSHHFYANFWRYIAICHSLEPSSKSFPQRIASNYSIKAKAKALSIFPYVLLYNKKVTFLPLSQNFEIFCERFQGGCFLLDVPCQRLTCEPVKDVDSSLSLEEGDSDGEGVLLHHGGLSRFSSLLLGVNEDLLMQSKGYLDTFLLGGKCPCHCVHSPSSCFLSS